MTDPPPHRWPEQTWREAVARVRAGRRLTHSDPASRWPGGAQVAVALSFDSDHETIPLRDEDRSPGRLAQGEYGARAGVPRIMALLAAHEIPATFFMPAVSALLHPEEAAGYVAAGHEVAVHGWIHERNSALEAAEERELLARSLDVLERLTGVRPVGVRTPSWDFSAGTLDSIRDLGFRYDSSLMADDEPYELLADGVPTGIVEIPVEWIRDDHPYFGTGMGGVPRPTVPPESVLGIWLREFEEARDEGGLFQLTLHPHVIGHRSRLALLRELVERLASHPGVWFTTHAGLADHVLAGPSQE